MLRDYGWWFVWARLYGWSVRPVSEAVLWLYDGAVTVAGTPLIAPFLLLLWAVLFCGGVLALWPLREATGAAWRLAIALTVLALFLLGHAVNEMFYWPMAAAPYLLTLAAIVVLTFRLIAGRVATVKQRSVCALALVVATGSSEAGLFFTLGFCATLALADLPRALRQPFAALAGRLWYWPPLIFALALLAVMWRFRVGNATVGLTPDATHFHNLGPSLLSALGSLPDEFAYRDPYWAGPVAKFATLLLLFLGLLGCIRVGLPYAVPRTPLLALVGGLVASAFGSMAAAYYQFGVLCCERHHTFRQCLVVLLVLVLARLLSRAGPVAGLLTRVGGPLCLVAATLVGLSTRLPAVVNDVGLLGVDRHAMAANWAALRDPGSTMVFHLPAHGAVIEGLMWAPGHVTRDAGGPWYSDSMLRYFRKSSGEVVLSDPPPAP